MDDVQGVPEGLTASPVKSEQVEGVPEGLTAEPIKPQTAQPTQQPPKESGMLSKIGSTAADVGTGFLKGAESTSAGIADLINKMPVVGRKLMTLTDDKSAPAGVRAGEESGINAMKAQSEPKNIAQAVGYGGETLTEFLLGDEALKGLSIAEKLSKASFVAKTLQNSPRLMNTLKLGASVGKAMGELGPEERALITKSPVLARLVGAGMDALRAGATQGAQTTVRTGDVKQGAKEGAETAAVAAPLGAVTGVVGGLLAKGSKAASTVQKMSKVAETAPEQEAITSKASQLVKNANDAMHSEYEQGVKDISGMIPGREPLEGSKLQDSAKKILQVADADAKPLDKAFGSVVPGSAQAKGLISTIAEGGLPKAEEAGDVATGVLDEQGNPVMKAADTAPQEPVTLDVNELIERRQQLGKVIRDLPYDDPDRRLYRRLIEGIDGTIKDMADKSGNAKAVDRLDEINENYRNTVKLFDNKDIQSLMKGNVNDVATRLFRGETSVDDMRQVKQLIGNKNMTQLAQDVFDRWTADATENGKFDPEKLIKKWNSIKPAVRDEMFELPSSPMQSPFAADIKKAVEDTKNAAAVKKLTRLGIVPAAGGFIYGPLGAMVGFLAHGGEYGGVGKVMDWVANNPKTWRAFQVGSNVAESGAVKAIPKVVGKETTDTVNSVNEKRKRDVFGAIASSLQ